MLKYDKHVREMFDLVLFISPSINKGKYFDDGYWNKRHTPFDDDNNHETISYGLPELFQPQMGQFT